MNQVKDDSSAIRYLQKALEIDADRPNAYKNLGLAYEALGDPETAAELFIIATQVNATDSRSLQHLISLVNAHPALEVDIPDLRERIKVCEKAVEVAPDNINRISTSTGRDYERSRNGNGGSFGGAEPMRSSTDKSAAPTSGIALGRTLGHHRPGVGEPERWATADGIRE